METFDKFKEDVLRLVREYNQEADQKKLTEEIQLVRKAYLVSSRDSVERKLRMMQMDKLGFYTTGLHFIINGSEEAMKEKLNKVAEVTREEAAKNLMKEKKFEEQPNDSSRKEDSKKWNLEYDGRTKGFLIIPDELIFSGEFLSHGAKMMWISIFKHNWSLKRKHRLCYPGRERLALMNGISIVQADRYINELKKKRILETKIRYGQKTNLYILHDPPVEWMKKTRKELEKAIEKKKVEELAKVKKQRAELGKKKD